MKSFLVPLAESKAPLQKGHFMHLQSRLYASKQKILLQEILILEGIKGFLHFLISSVFLLLLYLRKRLLEVFLLLMHKTSIESPANEVTYRELKVIFQYLRSKDHCLMHLFSN